MTPTLLGRWQIRFFLLGTVGVIVALVTGKLVGDVAGVPSLSYGITTLPLFVLLYVFVQGVILDLLYQYIISYRWDRDWPTPFQVAAGIFEGVLLWILIQFLPLPGVDRTKLPLLVYFAQYAITWFCIFVLTQGMLRVLWPNWHYHGGQWLVRHPKYYDTPPEDAGFQQPLTAQSPIQQVAITRTSTSRPRSSGPSALAFQTAGGPSPVTPIPPALKSSGPQAVLQPSGGRSASRPITPIPPVATRPFKCACGYTSDHLHGQNCPQCGREAVV
jgi:hypothetical protein